MKETPLTKEIMDNPERYPVIAHFWEIDQSTSSNEEQIKQYSNEVEKVFTFYKTISKILNFNLSNYEV
ncbi:MAG: hypothetical protein MJZ87_03375 [Bacteroidales bacterium]|nr:hypothetical protein [Bacteroidales bacterium]